MAFIVRVLDFFRKIAAKEITELAKELTTLSKKQIQDIAMYGERYKKTLSHDATELRIKFIELKSEIVSLAIRSTTKSRQHHLNR